jgi:hypothetical protein
MGNDLATVDIREELETFSWVRSSWSSDKLLAASPFRYDNQPSFYVYLTDTATAAAGSWGDSGASDPEWQRGGIVKLLAFLRDETQRETLDYLRIKYGCGPPDESDEPTLSPIKLSIAEPYRPLNARILDEYRFRHPYLERRGISEAVQRLLKIGYDRNRQAIVIPWLNPDCSLGNVKYRRVDSKTFWYEKGGRPIREMVYGLDVIYRKGIRRAAIVEAEIDAMTLMTAGIPAIATGGSGFGERKRELIVKSPLEEIVVFRDNDPAGRAWRNRIVDGLHRNLNVKLAYIPRQHKDVNEWWTAQKTNLPQLENNSFRSVRTPALLTINII